MPFQCPYVVTIDQLTVDKAGHILARSLRGDNIKVDLGSRASTDMSYTLSADVYLGDASSQVYEFLLPPRPCIFLNSQGHQWQGDPNFQHWTAGEVITQPEQLPGALERADELRASRYRAVQEDLFAQSFDLNDTPSSIRAANAVLPFAERHRRQNRHLKLVPA